MEPRLKSTRLIDGEVKGIMDNYVVLERTCLMTVSMVFGPLFTGS